MTRNSRGLGAALAAVALVLAACAGSRKSTEIAPQPVEGAVDPTGAGDAFSLLYVESRAGGAEPVEAATRAARIVAELISRP
jgi:sugar/nucleoside kinase (ribokinase family)